MSILKSSVLTCSFLSLLATPALAEHHEEEGAIAKLEATEGNSVQGTVTFTQGDKGVDVIGEISGLTPGKHGFHVHEKGDCSAKDGTSAGGHFNPQGVAHGGPDSDTKHVGDMGNVVADANGFAMIDTTFHMLSLEGEHSIIGKGLIVHAGVDDLHSQPTGDAGARVACGVIKASH